MELVTTIKKNQSYHTMEKIERNKEIVKDYNEWLVLGNGTWAKLVGKYGKSKQRLAAIVNYFIPLKEIQNYDIKEYDDYTKELIKKYKQEQTGSRE